MILLERFLAKLGTRLEFVLVIVQIVIVWNILITTLKEFNGRAVLRIIVLLDLGHIMIDVGKMISVIKRVGAVINQLMQRGRFGLRALLLVSASRLQIGIVVVESWMNDRGSWVDFDIADVLINPDEVNRGTVRSYMTMTRVSLRHLLGFEDFHVRTSVRRVALLELRSLLNHYFFEYIYLYRK